MNRRELEDVALSGTSPPDYLGLAAQIVSAYVSNNQVPQADLPGLVVSVRNAVSGMTAQPRDTGTLVPAVPIKKSVGDDFIICLEDGKRLTMLKRYLWSQYQLTPEAYRSKWGLPFDYPMVAPAYARLRSAFAKKIGLGRVGDPKRGGRGKKATA